MRDFSSYNPDSPDSKVKISDVCLDASDLSQGLADKPVWTNCIVLVQGVAGHSLLYNSVVTFNGRSTVTVQRQPRFASGLAEVKVSYAIDSNRRRSSPG